MNLFKKIKNILNPDTTEEKWFEKLGFVRDTHEGWNKGFIDGFDHATYMVAISQALAIIHPLVGWASILIGAPIWIALELYQGLKGNQEGWTDVPWYTAWLTDQHRVQDWVLPIVLSTVLLEVVMRIMY